MQCYSREFYGTDKRTKEHGQHRRSQPRPGMANQATSSIAYYKEHATMKT